MAANAIQLLLYRQGRWTYRTIPIQSPPAYVSMAAVGRGAAISYMAADTTSALGRNANSVFALSTRDLDRAPFSNPSLIESSGAGSGHAPILVKSVDGLLGLVWRQMEGGIPPGNSVKVSTSMDGGLTWARSTTINQGKSGLLPSAGFGRHSTLLLTAGSAADESELQLYSWDSQSVQPIGAPWRTETSPTFAALSPDSLLLTFATTHSVSTPAGPQRMPVTNLVTIVSCPRN